MNIYEAALAAKAGKKVKHPLYGTDAIWDRKYFSWASCGAVVVNDDNLTGWSIVEEPPKEYTFAEAYEMMKAGKWMKQVGSNDHRCCVGGAWLITQKGSIITYKFDRWPIEAIDSKWIEVYP